MMLSIESMQADNQVSGEAELRVAFLHGYSHSDLLSGQWQR